MNDTITKYGFYALIVAVVALSAYILGINTMPAFASAPPGLPASVATTSAAAVSTTASTLFATSTCNARIITTYADPVMLTFSDYAGQTPTATFGHLQSASTTVVYDSGQYGCGLVKAYSYGTQTITVTETR